MEYRKQFINTKMLLRRGNNEVSFILAWTQQSILIWLFIRDLFSIPRNLAVIIIPAYFILRFFLDYGIGKFWDAKKLIDEENEWVQQRTPMLKRIEGHVSGKASGSSS